MFCFKINEYNVLENKAHITENKNVPYNCKRKNKIS